jgi:RNA polymerase sigma factor (sigma-70 family)
MEDAQAVAARPYPAWQILGSALDGMEERLTYEEFLAPIEERMMRTIWRIVRHPDEAEDTMQDVLTLLWTKRDRISRHPNPQALALRICVNAAVDTLRKQRRGRSFVDPRALDRVPAPASGGWEQREAEIRIREAIGRLPRNQAAAVVMRILEGQSYGEIARVLGCREVTARTHVLRGRAKLVRWLSPLWASASKESMP